MWMLPGRNAAQSLSNLQGWLDNVAETYSPGCQAWTIFDRALPANEGRGGW